MVSAKEAALARIEALEAALLAQTQRTADVEASAQQAAADAQAAIAVAQQAQAQANAQPQPQPQPQPMNGMTGNGANIIGMKVIGKPDIFYGKEED